MPARRDNVTDPTLRAALLLARRGQAYYSRKLSELSDDDVDGPSKLPGWDRRHLIAHVGLNARALTRLTQWAATGVETPMYASSRQRREEIEMAATLPVQALRNLSDHAAIHLNVEWRDLEEAAWSMLVRTAQGRQVPVRETVWMRTREVWIHAVDLGNGATFDDFPPELHDAILLDVLRSWSRRPSHDQDPHFAFAPIDRPTASAPQPPERHSLILHGTASSLSGWATGRNNSGVVTADGRPAPTPPLWL